MPSMSGGELPREMRGERIQTAVIMITAATMMKAVHEALHMGIADFLVKPYSFERFQAAIERFLPTDALLKSGATVDQSAVDRLFES